VAYLVSWLTMVQAIWQWGNDSLFIYLNIWFQGCMSNSSVNNSTTMMTRTFSNDFITLIYCGASSIWICEAGYIPNNTSDLKHYLLLPEKVAFFSNIILFNIILFDPFYNFGIYIYRLAFDSLNAENNSIAASISIGILFLLGFLHNNCLLTFATYLNQTAWSGSL